MAHWITFPLRRISSYVWASLGHCSLCARKAFIAAASAWIMLLLVVVILGNSQLLVLSEIAAVGLSVLWLAHLIAFASKVSNRKSGDDVHNLGRRAAFPMFAQTLAFAAVVSAAPRLVQAASTKQDREFVVNLQRKLKEAGDYQGDVDGLAGPETHRAIQSYRQANSLGSGNGITNDLVQKLGLVPPQGCAFGCLVNCACCCGPGTTTSCSCRCINTNCP
jgi:hypothetical protein